MIELGSGLFFSGLLTLSITVYCFEPICRLGNEGFSRAFILLFLTRSLPQVGEGFLVELEFSLLPDKMFPLFRTTMVSVAQLVRASGCGPEGHGFEPHHSPQNFYGK